MKKNKIFRILLIGLLSMLAVFTTLFMISAINGSIPSIGFNLFNRRSNKLIVDETYSIEFEKIDIDASAGNISFKESSDDRFKVVIYDNDENTTVRTEHQTLSIYQKKKINVGINFQNEISSIEVYVPSGYANEIKIKNDFGEIEVASFPNASIEVEEAYGNVTISEADFVNVINDFGDVNLGKIKKATVNCSYGNLTIENVEDIVTNCDLGNIEIENVSNYLDLTNNYGDIKLKNIYLNVNSKIQCSLGDIEIGNTNDLFIDANTELGDMNIEKNNSKSEISLMIKNENGNINVLN